MQEEMKYVYSILVGRYKQKNKLRWKENIKISEEQGVKS